MGVALAIADNMLRSVAGGALIVAQTLLNLSALNALTLLVMVLFAGGVLWCGALKKKTKAKSRDRHFMLTSEGGEV